MDSEYVPVSEEFKSRVIGRDGSVLNSIRERSGAIITSRYTEEEGFTVSGNDQQRETAKRLILEKVFRSTEMRAASHRLFLHRRK